MIPSVGRIVHYHLENGDVRPAIIVRTWGDDESSAVNLQVFVDGMNDLGGEFSSEECRPGVSWKTSAVQGFDPGCWSDPRAFDIRGPAGDIPGAELNPRVD